jgi:hypothetical protein
MQFQIDDAKRPKLIKLAVSGAIVFIHPCCKCGNLLAPFGYGCTFLGKKPTAGKWYCGKCKPKEFLTQSKLL